MPIWTAVLAVALGEASPYRLEITVETAKLRWHETPRVAPNADASALRQAMTWLAMRYHPDKGRPPSTDAPEQHRL